MLGSRIGGFGIMLWINFLLSVWWFLLRCWAFAVLFYGFFS